MLTTVLKAVKMLLFCCPKNSQDAAVLAALKAIQDAEKNHPHKDYVQRLIPITHVSRWYSRASLTDLIHTSLKPSLFEWGKMIGRSSITRGKDEALFVVLQYGLKHQEGEYSYSWYALRMSLWAKPLLAILGTYAHELSMSISCT
jgi:hypothetical protein